MASQKTTLIYVDTIAELSGFVTSKPIMFCLEDNNFYYWVGSTPTAYTTGGNGWQTIEKTTTETKQSDTALIDDSELQLNLLPASCYVMRGILFFFTGATSDIRFRFNFPETPVRYRQSRKTIAAASTTLSNILVETDQTTILGVLGASSGNGMFEFELFVETNLVNPCLFAVQWAQNSSIAEPTVLYNGSYFDWRKVY